MGRAIKSPDVPAGEEPAGNAAVPPTAVSAGVPKLPALSLRNWPVSRRLIAVIIIAVAMGVIFGGLRVAAAAGVATGYAHTTQLAVLGEEVTALAQAMENERDLTAALCAITPTGCPSGAPTRNQTASSLFAQLQRAQAATNAEAARVQALAAQIGSAFPANTQVKATTVIARIGSLAALRSGLAGQPPQSAIEAYSEAIADLFTLNDEITSSSGDVVLSDEVRTLGSLSRAKDQTSAQRAILYAALLAGSLNGVGGLQALTTAQALETANLIAFQSSATAAEIDAYLNTVNGEKVDTAQLINNFLSVVNKPRLTLAQVFAQTFSDVRVGGQFVSPATTPALLYSTMTDTIARMRAVEQQVAGSIVARSQSLQHGARQSEVLTMAVTATVLLLVLVLTFIVARSLVHPLRRLQADALEIATRELPARVAALSEVADPDVHPSLEVEPISVHSTDEIGKVARAFDQVHHEAVRLAGNEALLRGSLSAMFISLSRRSVPLVERLTRMIDSMEQNEDDPDRLYNLFAMDHLVTRMRRNSENLLVLAGEEPVRKWSEPVPLTDVARAATSEIEQYGRVVLNIQPEVVISGQAASDIVHLLAELIENATMFSPRDTPVHVSGLEISTGGVLLEVRDSGVGVSAGRLAEMNWRLDNPPLVDVSVSRHMGLFAVSRLAARHGIRVRLRAGSPQGLSALVWLPGSLTGRASVRHADRRSGQLTGESAVAGLRVGGRRTPGRYTLGPRAAAGEQQDNGAHDDGAQVMAAAGAGGTGQSNWFRAKRPSGAAARRGDATAAAGRDYGMQITMDPGTSTTMELGTGTGAGTSGQDGTWDAFGTHSRPGGWRIAETVSTPARGDRTAAGLPTRVPGANLFPGSASGGESWDTGEMQVLGLRTPSRGTPARPSRPPRRSPELARSRLSGFQLGSREAADRESSAGVEGN